MPRGGRRSGKVGKQYPNRADLSMLSQTAPSKQYGSRAAQERSIDALPPGPPPSTPVPPGSPPAGPGGGGGLLPFNRPTDRPGEPLTHGLSTGPGMGPEVLHMPTSDPSLDELRAIYQMFPTEQLRELIEDAG